MKTAEEFLRERIPERAVAWEAKALETLQTLQDASETVLPWPWIALREIGRSREFLQIESDLGSIRLEPRTGSALRIKICTDLVWSTVRLPEGVAYTLSTQEDRIAARAVKTGDRIRLCTGDEVRIDFTNNTDVLVASRVYGQALIASSLHCDPRTCAICDAESGVFSYCRKCVLSGRAPDVFHGSVLFS